MYMSLVTGAAGLNGSAIVREFSRNGVAVRALVRDRSRAIALVELPYVELVEGDMARAETLDRVLEGIDRALMISSSSPQMLETQRRFVDACKAAGVAHVVKFSGKESSIGFDANKFLFTLARRPGPSNRYFGRILTCPHFYDFTDQRVRDAGGDKLEKNCAGSSQSTVRELVLLRSGEHTSGHAILQKLS